MYVWQERDGGRDGKRETGKRKSGREGRERRERDTDRQTNVRKREGEREGGRKEKEEGGDMVLLNANLLVARPPVTASLRPQ